jgi:hypothetical protein
VIGVLLGTYLKLALSEVEQADYSNIYNMLINLAEGGAEDAVWEAKHGDWTGWREATVSGTLYKVSRTTSIDLGTGKTGQLTVFVENYDTFPIIYATARRCWVTCGA